MALSFGDRTPPLFFRVMAVTDHSDNSGISTTSHTYCLASTKIWITEDDLENPVSDVLVITEIWHNNIDVHVAFEYDGGRYHGYFEVYNKISKSIIPNIFRNSGIENFMALEDISSL